MLCPRPWLAFPNMIIKHLSNYSILTHRSCDLVVQRCSELSLRQFSRLVSHSPVVCLDGRSADKTTVHRCFSFSGEQRTPAGSKVIGETHKPKRFVGRSSRFIDADVSCHGINVGSSKYRLKDKTKTLLKIRVSRLQSSLLLQKAKLRDKLRAQKMKGALAVGTFRKQFATQVLWNKAGVPDCKMIFSVIWSCLLSIHPAMSLDSD